MLRFIRVVSVVVIVGWMAMECPRGESFGQETRSVTLPKIAPPEFEGERREIPLPASVDDIVLGGAGRYLALHFKSLGKIGIFDVNQLKITGYVTATDEDAKFAAGANKLIVVSGKSGVVSRWNLATLERELVQTIDLGGNAGVAIMGSASAGPAIVGGGSDRFGGQAFQIDLESLRATPFKCPNMNRGVGPRANVRISSNGAVLGVWESGVSPSGLQSYVKTGDQWNGYYEHTSVGAIVPSPDGRLLYTSGGIFTNQLRRLGSQDQAARMGQALPAAHGPYALLVALADNPDPQRRTFGVRLLLEGESRPLGALPNLEPLPSFFGPSPQQAISWDKRLYLIPDAKVVVQLASSNEKLLVVKFDVTKALQESDIDYLIVSSRPPLSVKAGEQFAYQLDVKSKAADVKYSLEAAPAGMAISSKGLVTWSTSAASPARANVVLSISNASDRQIFHTFDLVVSGGDPKASPVATSTAGEARGPVPPLTTTPAELKADSVEVKLPATASDVAVGGNGRFLLYHLRDLKRIAVLDVSQAKIAGYLPASDDDTKFTAGATRALVFSPSQGVVTRYRLDTLQRELSVAIPVPDAIHSVGMGGGSEGPVLVRASKGTGSIDPCFFYFLDLQSLKPIEVTWDGGQPLHSVVRDSSNIHVAMNGDLFVVSGTGMLRLDGTMVRANLSRGQPMDALSADGRFLFSNGRILKSDQPAATEADTSYGLAIPAVTGNFFLSLSANNSPSSFDQSYKTGGKLYLLGDNRPLITIPDVQVTSPRYAPNGVLLNMQKRLFLVPDAQVMVTLLPSNDRIELRKLNIDQALEASGVDYLYVTSQAPFRAELGKPYVYSMQVKSKSGGVKFTLDAGPEGMKLSPDGKISWSVPQEVDQTMHKAIVSVSDASGQSIFHTFSIDIPEVREKLAAQQRQRNEQARLSQLEAQRKQLEDLQRAQAAQMAALEQARARAKEAPPTGAPLKPAAAEKFRPTMRTWTDSTGQHKLVARFVELVNKNTVVLELEGGEKRNVPLSKLANEDIYEAVKSDLLSQGAVAPKSDEKSPFVPQP